MCETRISCPNWSAANPVGLQILPTLHGITNRIRKPGRLCNTANYDRNPIVLSLLHQLVELQKENIELRRQATNDQHYKDNYVRKPERPVIELDSSNGDWILFMDTWNQYKEMCKLTNPSTIYNELRMACIPELNRLLFDLMGAEALNMASGDQLLQYIKLVAVRGLHKEVHWQNFHSMKQKEGESIIHFFG